MERPSAHPTRATTPPCSESRPYASRPLSLALTRLEHLAEPDPSPLALSERELEAARHRVTLALDRVRNRIHGKALDVEFSVALRERWQHWPRVATPIQEGDAVEPNRPDPPVPETAAAAPPQDAPISVATQSQAGEVLGRLTSDDDDSDDDEGASPDEALLPPPKRQKSGRGCVKSCEGQDWDTVRRGRAQLLKQMDRRLPPAFRFTEDQTTMFSRRIKTKNDNSLDRPFAVDEIRNLIHANSLAKLPYPSGHAGDEDAAPSAAMTGSPAEGSVDQSGPSRNRDDRWTPTVLQFSFFWSTPHIDQGRSEMPEATASAQDSSFIQPRSTVRGKGEGPSGLRRSQTIEVRSDQPLSVIPESLFCWSNDQPERVGSRKRLARDVLGEDQHEAIDRLFQDDPNEDDVADQDGQGVAFARFTGRKRASDYALYVESQLYGGGLRAGEQSWETDYASLLAPHFSHADDRNRPPSDLSTRFDEIPALRVGQPYWMLHQGDCVHCFTLDSVRALRPEERPQHSSADASPLARFPRVTWLSTTALLRFTSNKTDNIGVGQRILSSEGHAYFRRHGTGFAGLRGAEHSRAKAWLNDGYDRKRKEDSVLTLRFGKCVACRIRKAQIGIVGGERVRIKAKYSSGDADERGGEEELDEVTMRGLDEQVVSICPQCAVVMGVARLKQPVGEAVAAGMVSNDGHGRIGGGRDDEHDGSEGEAEEEQDEESGTDVDPRNRGSTSRDASAVEVPASPGPATSGSKDAQTPNVARDPRLVTAADIELDWTCLNTDESRENGWTAFPLY